MPAKKGVVADAWDDDWESLADKHEEPGSSDVHAPAKLSKAEQRAQHAELNRRIWSSAENAEPKLFLDARSTAPIASTFKPTVTMLSRKPPQLLSRNGQAGATATAGEEDNSEEERQKQAQADLAVRVERARQERIDKERRYAEAREKIFGSPAGSDESRAASPGKPARGKGRSRAGREGQTKSSEQSPARPAISSRQLYEPSYAPKPGSVYIHKKEASTGRPKTPSDNVEKPVREPHGPKDVGKGGRGFVSRGGHGSTSSS